MKDSQPVLLSLFACLLASPFVVAQPTIGGGSCSTSTINGTYAVSLTGRGVTPSTATPPTSGSLIKVFQGIGSAAFDGQSKVTFNLTVDTNTSTGTTTTWTGTYSVQANCAGTVTITSGGSATLNLELYNTGAAFSLTGQDSSIAYTGNGNTIATGCATSTLIGVYALTATQGFYAVTNGTAGGAFASSGIVQFDGLGNVTANTTGSANSLLAGVTATEAGFNFTGTYSLGSNCVGTAKFVSSVAGTFNVNFVVYTATANYSSQMFISLATTPPQALVTGNAYAIYGQPTSTASVHRGLHGFGGMLAKLVSGKSHKGDRA